MKDFRGTALFTSRDHALTESVATRIIELTPKGGIDRMMNMTITLTVKMLQN